MKYSKALMLGSIGLATLVVSASAATIDQTGSMNSSENWNQGAFWSDGLAPSADNDYVTGGNLVIRTPGGSVGNTTFGGNSLTIKDTASLFLRANGSNQSTVNRLIVETNNTASGTGNWQVGPRIHNAVGNITRLNGSIELTGSGSVTFDPEASDRTITINSQLTAASTVQQIIARGRLSGGTVIFTNEDNAFSGTWVAQNATLRGTVSGSFGTGSFVVKDKGVLDFGYDFSNLQSTLSLEVGGQLVLSRDLTLGSLIINGNSLAAGTYSFDQLDAQYSDYFSGTSGIGSITVVPEPSQVAVTMVGVAAMLMLCHMRRRKA